MEVETALKSLKKLFAAQMSFSLIFPFERSKFPDREENCKILEVNPISFKYINQPVSPCCCGAKPVAKEVIAEAVPAGNTEVIFFSKCLDK